MTYKISKDLIWMAWSGFGQMNLVQKQTGVQETSNLFVVNTSELTPIRCELELACFTGAGASLTRVAFH